MTLRSDQSALRGYGSDSAGLRSDFDAARFERYREAGPTYAETHYLDIDPPSQRLAAAGVFSAPAGIGLLAKLRRLPTTESGLVVTATPGATANASLYLYRPAEAKLFLRGRTAAGGNTILTTSVDLATDAPIVVAAYQDATTWWFRVAVGGAVVHADTGALTGTPTTPADMIVGGAATLPWGSVAGDVDLIYAAPTDGLPTDVWLASASDGPVDPQSSGVVTHVYRADAFAIDGEGFAAPDDLGGPALVAANMTLDDRIEL